MVKFIPDSKYSLHLPLKDRKSLLPRLLFSINFDSKPYSIVDDKNVLDQLRKIRDEVVREADSIFLIENDKCQLDSFLKEIIKCIKKIRKFAGDSRELRSRTAQFIRDIRQISCSQCSQLHNGHICNGSSIDDNRAISNDGKCWQPLYELFEFALKNSEGFYQKYIHKFSALPILNVVFKTISHRRDYSIINASTEFDDDASSDSQIVQRISIIKITIPIQKFNAKNYFSLLYAFFHELIVHAAQNLLCTKRRSVNGEDCSFSEGFVDAIAYHITKKVLTHHATLSKNIARYAQSFSQQATTDYQNRIRPSDSFHGVDDSNIVAAINARRLGSDLFNTLISLRHDDSWILTLVLSLNVEDLDKIGREKLIAKLYRIVESDIFCMKRAELLNSLDKYVETGDVNYIREFIL